MRRRAMGALGVVVCVAGCHATVRTECTPAQIQVAVEEARRQIDDPLAVMPAWYRSGLRASHRICTTTERRGLPPLAYTEHITSTAQPLVVPTPLLRLAAVAVVLPLLIVTLCNPFRDAFQDQVLGIRYRTREQIVWNGCWLSVALGAAALAVPFLVALPMNGLFRLFAFAAAGDGYYVPWHCLTFHLLALTMIGLVVANVRPLVHWTTSGLLWKATLGWTVILLEIAGFGFTVRDLLALAAAH